jgi:hypothetical protein
MPDANLLLLETAAVRLGTLLESVVFVGGATVGLLITDDIAQTQGSFRGVTGRPVL